MLEHELNKKLVDDIARILQSQAPQTQASASAKQPSWAKRTKEICAKLNTPTGPKELLDQISELYSKEEREEEGPSGDVNNNPAVKRWIADTVAHVKQALRALDTTPYDSRRKITYAKESPEDYLPGILRMLQRHDRTVTGYHAIELYGSVDALRSAIIEGLRGGAATATREIRPENIRITIRDLSETSDYRTLMEKVIYYYVQPWIVTPLMPLVVIDWAE